MSKFILGIDGGGTKTRAAIVDEGGSLLGTGKGGGSNYDDVGTEAAQTNIGATVAAAWEDAGLAPHPFDAVFLGMAGVVSPTDQGIIHQIAMNLELASADCVGVDHDCRVALAGGLSGRPGIVQIAGTGSSCFGINEAGERWMAGGWGELISDEGSSYWLGVQAMIRAVRAYDGREGPTILLERVLDHLKLGSVNDIMHRLYSQGVTRAEIARLAPAVIEAARQGDWAAQDLVQRGVSDLADCVLAVAKQLGMGDAPELALVGGLMNAVDVFVSPLKEAVWERLPGCSIQRPERVFAGLGDARRPTGATGRGRPAGRGRVACKHLALRRTTLDSARSGAKPDNIPTQQHDNPSDGKPVHCDRWALYHMMMLPVT
jgi:glucosamine kinase